MQSLGGAEFIFDIQTHHVNPNGPWRSALHPFNLVLRTFPQAKCGDGFLDDIFGSIDCFASRNFIKEIFLDSDTDMAVLSYVPSRKEDMPLTLAEGDETRRIVEAMEGSQRLFIHGPVNPRVNGDIDLMQEMLDSMAGLGVENLYAMGPGWRRILARRSGLWDPLYRKGARVGTQTHLYSQGPAVSQHGLRAQSEPRRRCSGKALSGRRLHRLPRGVRQRWSPKASMMPL